MLVTKNVAELCVLLISELYGQLPSRIFADLIARGRSTIAQVAHHTSLNQKQVRHGIAVLIQLNLLYYLTDQDLEITHYEASAHAAYSLLRIGKILDLVRTNYGPHAHFLVHEVLVEGHAKISDLVDSFKKNHGTHQEMTNGTSQNGHNHVNGNGTSKSGSDLTIEDDETDPEDQAYDALAQLIGYGILEQLTPTMYQSAEDLRTAAEQDYLADHPAGVRGAKQRAEFEKHVKNKLQDMQARNTALKRKLAFELENSDTPSKRQKLTNGNTSDTSANSYLRYILGQELDTVVRVNHDKCEVELRNLKLERYAEDLVGETTAKVYATLLAVLSKKISSCHVDNSLEEEENSEESMGPSVTSQEVFEHLSSSIDVSAGIGMLHDEDAISIPRAEKIRRYPPQLKGSILQDTLEEGEEIIGSDDEEYDETGEEGARFLIHGQNDSDEAKAELDDLPVGAERLHQMRQHLLILAESKEGFVRHCGARGFGEWTVDFEPLLQHLKFVELDTLIENRFGRQGLRLTRILREKGKIDDKTLPGLALMKKPDVHVKMAEMEMAGFLDVQEVPRDNNRAAARTIFFWFFDLERTLQRILDNTYKSLVRCLERLEVERRKKRRLLEIAERKDVQGNEADMLRGDVYNEYIQFIDIEKKLLGQMAKLDDIVAVFRDF
ncbi:hypothetical protein M426DRAFT_320708 [Hypoxylon sp. CI-4A]|nr:hypothetical protein M426DRAFT_320708 [Hypoxylon sp. CI-4A]